MSAEVDWTKVAPRWSLVTAITLLVLYAVFVSGQLVSAKDQQLAEMQEAMKKTPNGIQAQLSEDIAVLKSIARHQDGRLDRLEARDEANAKRDELILSSLSDVKTALALLSQRISKGARP